VRATLVKSPSADLSHQLPVTLLYTPRLYVTIRHDYCFLARPQPAVCSFFVSPSRRSLFYIVPSCYSSIRVVTRSDNRSYLTTHNSQVGASSVLCASTALHTRPRMLTTAQRNTSTTSPDALLLHWHASSANDLIQNCSASTNSTFARFQLYNEFLHPLVISLVEIILSLLQPASAKKRQSLQLVATKFQQLSP